MARFYGSMVNSRGNKVTANDANNAHLRGWDAGVRITRRVIDDRDVFIVSMTHGSNGNGSDIVIGTVTSTDFGPHFTSAQLA